MKKKEIDILDRPSVAQLESEYDRVRYKSRYQTLLKSTVYTLITVAAIAVLIATLILPVFQIYGKTMNPTLENGDIVVSVKTSNLRQGDIVAFYYNNSVLVKRVIATQGDWVSIDEDGTVTVNDVVLEEPYLIEKALGDTDIEYPYQVPDGKIFVMGDNRATSIDSRNSTVGCVAQEQIVGKILFRVWPFERMGAVE